MRFMTTLWKKIKNVFVPEIMVGVSERRQPVNRKERRAAASIARKNRNNPRRKKS